MAEISVEGAGQPAERPVAGPAWRERRWLLLGIAVAILALFALLFYGLRNNPNVESGGAVSLDRAAPDFSVTALDGSRLRLGDLRGKVVVLNIFGSWCLPCHQEAEALNQVHNRYQAQGRDVVFVGIAWNDEDSEVRKFVQRYNVPYLVALDHDGRIAIDYGKTGVPETFFIDREGRLTQKWVGPITAPRLSALLDQMVR
ncbi:MAG: TlpA family protein disulfide reductase [Chloroflexota bacterium]|nr:TlpA family protein disulfide reductase [Chloroflexota bacterium]